MRKCSDAAFSEVNVSMQDGTTHRPLAALMPALHRLDRLLDLAVTSMQSSGGVENNAPFRGLYISAEEASRLLSQQPAVPLFGAHNVSRDDPAELSAAESPLAWLIQTFELSFFDADLVLLALAPELDLRYEKIYAYLQDDVTRKRPTVELALNLLCHSAEEKLSRRSHFSQQSHLIRHGLLHLARDPNQVEPPFLALYLKVDAQVTRLLLGDTGLDPRLAHFCDLMEPAANWNELTLSADVKHVLPYLVTQALAAHQPLRLYFQGLGQIDKREAAKALAAAIGRKLLAARIDRIVEKPDFALLWNLVLREARIHGAMLYIADLDDLRGEGAARRRQDLLDAVGGHTGVTILAGQQPWHPSGTGTLGVIPIVFEIPALEERYTCWKVQLENLSLRIEPRALELLAARFRLTGGQITEAVTTALLRSQWRAARSTLDQNIYSSAPFGDLLLEELAAAARAQCGHELASLAHKIEPRYEWGDIVLPPDQMAQLREICSQAEHRHVVYDEWGFDRKLSLGKGLNVLFFGPPGTGKTMGAEVIAHELRLDLYRIDLSQVISKYIGETEKNLDRIFTAAETSNAILFFDEADSLFGKRSEVRDSHDRYANIEISYLLQKMEEYQGISILATNLRKNLDEAFVRRLQAIVEFPFPDEEYRRQIWKGVFPKETPLADDVNVGLIARKVQLAGGNIKNIALTAAFYAAANGSVVRMAHLIKAAHREHQKLGRSWDETGLSPMTIAV